MFEIYYHNINFFFTDTSLTDFVNVSEMHINTPSNNLIKTFLERGHAADGSRTGLTS
ncbi:hypothetical protein X975_24894, partial [Stegodyphus mimosarum]